MVHIITLMLIPQPDLKILPLVTQLPTQLIPSSEPALQHSAEISMLTPVQLRPVKRLPISLIQQQQLLMLLVLQQHLILVHLQEQQQLGIVQLHCQTVWSALAHHHLSRHCKSLTKSLSEQRVRLLLSSTKQKMKTLLQLPHPVSLNSPLRTMVILQLLAVLLQQVASQQMATLHKTVLEQLTYRYWSCIA